MKTIFTPHSLVEIKRRQIKKELVTSVIENPQQRIQVKKERVILQGKYFDDTQKKEMLLRVIGKETREEFMVITAYKTSKIEKYWQKEE